MKQRQGPKAAEGAVTPALPPGRGQSLQGELSCWPWESGAQGTKGRTFEHEAAAQGLGQSRRFSGPQFTKHEGKGIKISDKCFDVRTVTKQTHWSGYKIPSPSQ